MNRRRPRPRIRLTIPRDYIDAALIFVAVLLCIVVIDWALVAFGK